MRLVSFDLCPYVQRCVIVLEEKAAPYTVEYIDLANKPAWFLDISPHGRVPLLEVDGTVLFESLAIMEYLDEAHAPRLHPTELLARARDRAWFPVVDGLFTAQYLAMVAPDEARFEAQVAAIRRHLAKLETAIAGPLWRAGAFTLMDAVAWPGLQRLGWLEAAFGDLGLLEGTPKITAWIAALQDRPSIQRSLVPDIEARFRTWLARESPVYRARQARADA